MGRNLLRVPVHFVWATWDRLPLITEPVETRLHRYISGVCRNDNCEVLAIGGMPDHVHVLVRLSGTVSLSDLMKHVKGGSSRFASETLLGGEWFAWQGSYGAFAVDADGTDDVIGYIRGQKRHHADGTTRPEMEQTQAPAAPGVLSLSAQADPRREAPRSDEFIR